MARREPTAKRTADQVQTHAFTPEAHAALQRFEDTQQHVFLTGRAGTGKSTLLQHFRATTTKRIVVLAPTGVAAVNVQGQTIHSFFRFGPGITPDKARRRMRGTTQLYRHLRTIVIDEISMVRADLLDCIDQFLRTVWRCADDFHWRSVSITSGGAAGGSGIVYHVLHEPFLL